VLIATGGRLGETLDFSPMAKNWMVNRVTEWNKNPEFALPARVVFIHFDFEATRVLAYEHAFPLHGTKTPSRKSSDWKELTDPPADHKEIDVSTHANNQNTTMSLSITNVYTSIRQLPAGSVLDVSIFSHAYVRGPVLINTSDTEDRPGGSAERTAMDMDGRARTDFNPNMGEAAAGSAALATFVANFDPKAHFRVFGCNIQDVLAGQYKRSAVFQIVHQAYSKPVRANSTLGKKLRKKQVPTELIPLDMWEEMMNEAEKDATPAAWKSLTPAARNTAANALLQLHRTVDLVFYPEPNADVTKPPDDQQIERSWNDIRALVAWKVAEGYVFKAAEALSAHGVTCHGAPPCVGGNNEGDPRQGGLMRVCATLQEFGCDDSFAPWLRFYKDYFFVGKDGTDRQHIDLCGAPLRRALALSGESQD